MSKFAFINPGTRTEFSVTAPINLALLAAVLEKHGIEVIIIDELAGQDIRTKLDQFTPDIVGVTATTTQFNDAIAAAKISRELGFRTIIGGRHVLIRPEEARPYFDMIVQGEAEARILDIATGKLREKLIVCKPINRLEDFPPPSWHLLDMDFYSASRRRILNSFLNFSPAEYRVGTLLSSRGCPYDCLFCHNSWKGLKYRSLSLERILEDVKELVTKYAIQSIFFIDDDFFFDRKRLGRFCDLLINNDIDLVWGCNARVTDVTEDSLARVKQAGCAQVTFGFESGSQRILDVLNKKTTVEQGSKAVAMSKKAGLQVSGTFIIGTPSETLKDIELTKQFIRDHDIDSIGITLMTPFPGTRLWDWCEEHNFIPADFTWSDLDYNTIPPIRTNENFTPDELFRLYREVRKIVSRKVTRRKFKERSLFSKLGWTLKHPVKTAKILCSDVG